MTEKKITIIFDPDKCVDGEEDFDLFNYLLNELNNSGIVTRLMEEVLLD